MRIVIPVKPFAEAKRRLASAMDATARARLAHDMFRHVFAAAVEFAGPRSLMIVSRSAEILQFAIANGATGLPEVSEPDLNAALAQSAAHARAHGVGRLIVVASDLPLLHAQDLAILAEYGCAIAPDRHGRGTNALSWPLTRGPGFHFGENSFVRHCAAARRCGLEPHTVVLPGLGHDIDIPDDLIDRLRVPETVCARKTR
ncbi:MAG: 2-phospho-L-lactate guanylyltransferase [Rhizomicrobium sp.]